ncbi:MAG: pitrilysin family protein, partial [Myxococcota bacterium]|nr:pitrilysin family protein [Myxococcota bacterium]
LAYLTACLLTRGTARRTQAQLSEDLDTMGSSLGISVGRETTSVTGDALTRNLDEFQALVREVLCEPSFPEDEIARLKRQTIAELRQVRDNDAALAKRFFVRGFYGDHVYGRPLRGTEASLESITRDDIIAFYQAHYTREDAISGACGDLDRDRFAAYVTDVTEGLEAPAQPPVPIETMGWPSGYRLQLIDKPERTQTQIFIGHPTLDANHDDYVALFMAHTIFGGTFTARLSQEIREKRGWSYGAYSYLHGDRHMGTFVLRFYPGHDDTIPALEVADDLFRTYCSEGPTAEELEASRRYIVNSHPMSLETAEKRLHERLACRLLGREDGWSETFVPAVQALTLDDLNRAIERHLSPDDVFTTVVCTAAPLLPKAEAWGRAQSTDVID